MVGTLMAGIDDRIVVIGLPTIIRELNSTVGEGIWIGQAYTLAMSFALLLVGRVTDLYGRVKIYNIGFIIFTIGSALASLSNSSGELIAFRLVQGVGASFLNANSVAIVTDASPEGELGTLLGINRVAFRFGAVTGLTLAGVIIAFLDWRALFYINIPVGIFGTIWARMRLREIATKDTAKKMDWTGFFTFTSGITLLLVALTLLSYGASSILQSIAMLVAAIFLLSMFVMVERKTETPLLDLKLFRVRQFATGSTIVMFSTLAWNGMIYMMSFFVQIILGFSSLQAGLSYILLELPYLVVGMTSGKLSDKYGSRGLATAGLGMIATSCIFASTFTSSTVYTSILIFFVLLAVGQGLFTSPNQRAIMSSVPANRRGVAAGFSGTLTQVGNTAGPVVAITLITIGIPFGLFTNLIDSVGASQIVSQVVKDQFVNGFKIMAFVLGVIDALWIVPSWFRGGTSAQSIEAQSEKTHEK
jgi:EmrB/QacA subfamily drug resistance transporter